MEKEEKNTELTEKDKMKAAYALNMCTVSVSQIVDYNDLFILEQEYDAILNNLNLENIPKDDALLKILVELLNTITFFRIQEIKKSQIEKKYQNRMKNAIWSAIPNIGVIVTGGNPIAIGAALATQIGAGYMNYRKEKARSLNDKEDAEIELEIAAIEQFNALRRELFTTAWRLSAKYDFSDDLRLTERQINQYNSILLDQDYYRQYARLEAIQDNFKAYPPFWYFMGHAASYIASTSNNVTKKLYLEKAKNHFDDYKKMDGFSILRENQMTASCDLEYIDILFLENEGKNGYLKLKDSEKKQIKQLLNDAIKNAGNHFDIIQLCVISYLRIEEYTLAQKYLKILVNEDYNKIINAQILSGLLVNNKDVVEYDLLSRKIPEKYLFPLPKENNINIDLLSNDFSKTQRRLLKEKFKYVLRGSIDKYTEEINKKISNFSLNKTYDDEFYKNTERSKRARINELRILFMDVEKRDNYIERLRNVNLPLLYTDLLDELFINIFRIRLFNSDADFCAEITSIVRDTILKYKDDINELQDKLDDKQFDVNSYIQLQKYGIMFFVSKAFEKLFVKACNYIDEIESDRLMFIDADLIQLCETVGISDPDESFDEYTLISVKDNKISESLFDISLFGSWAILAKQNATFLSEMSLFAKNKLETIKLSGEIKKIYRGENKAFNTYFTNSIFNDFPDLESHSIAILKNDKDQMDLIFTTEGIVYIRKKREIKKVPYDKITLSKDKLDLWGIKYKSQDYDVNELFEVVQEIKNRFIVNSQNKIDYISTELKPETVNNWFKENKVAMGKTVQRVYALPTKENLQAFQFCLDKEYDCNHNLLQFYYDTEKGYILDMRILEFEKINTDFKNLLNKNGVLIV